MEFTRHAFRATATDALDIAYIQNKNGAVAIQEVILRSTGRSDSFNAQGFLVDENKTAEDRVKLAENTLKEILQADEDKPFHQKVEGQERPVFEKALHLIQQAHHFRNN